MTVRANKSAFNLREKLKELTHNIGLKGRELMSAATVQEARDLVSAGRRNLIINGDMRISQRGTTFTGFSSGQYSLDRWMMGSAHANFTITQGTSTLPNGRAVNTFKIECDTATSNWLDPYQGIEDIHIIANQTVTISAWVKTNHPLINFRQYGMQNFGDVMIPDGQWHHYSVTTTLGNLTLTKGGNIGTAFFGITNKQTTSWTIGQYIEFTHFQLELGENATEFEHRPIGEELALCQRYYVRYNSFQPYTRWGLGMAQNNASLNVIIHHPVEMRGVPTVIEDSGTGTIQASNTFQGYTSTASAVLTGNTGSNKAALVSVAVNVGLTQGNPYFLEAANNVNAYIAFGCEI